MLSQTVHRWRLNGKEEESREEEKRNEQKGIGQERTEKKRGQKRREERHVPEERNPHQIMYSICKIHTPTGVPIFVLVSSKTLRTILLWIRNE